MKPKTMKVLELCIEEGLVCGWNRAHKHNENPTETLIRSKQFDAIVELVYEWFDMGEKDD